MHRSRLLPARQTSPVSTTRDGLLAVGGGGRRRDDELCRALFRTAVDDVGLRELALSAAGGHVVDVAAVRRGAAVAAEDARQLRRLAIARVSTATATPEAADRRCTKTLGVAAQYHPHTQ